MKEKDNLFHYFEFDCYQKNIIDKFIIIFNSIN